MATQTRSAYPTVRRGDTGEFVLTVQRTLNVAIKANLIEDGIFGSATEEAVRRFQGREGLLEDGIVGSNTWAKLFEYFDNH